MTTNERLIRAALDAADLFREGDTPDSSEVRELVRAADDYQAQRAIILDHERLGRLMCAVRALTEGDPAATWNPEREGATISGVVLRQGEVSTNLGPVPFVDLWQGGTGRVRVMAYSGQLQVKLTDAAAQIGDWLQVWYGGEHPIGRLAGKTYKAFSVNVQRGH
jgi:hypothetical protein